MIAAQVTIEAGDVVTLEYHERGKDIRRQMIVTKTTPLSVCGHPEGAPAVTWRVERYRVVGVQKQ